MKTNKNIEDEFENQQSFLDDNKKDNHFSTPKNYFESLPEIVNHKKLTINKISFVFDNLSHRVVVPILSFTVLFFIFLNWNKKTETLYLSTDQISEILIDESIIEIDEELIFENYEEILSQDIKEFSDSDEMINYLIENNININYIIEEL